MTRGVLSITLLVSVALGGWLGCAGPDPRTGQHVAGATAVAGSFAFGDVTVDHNWKRVSFGRQFIDPVVIAKPFSSNGGDPGVVRIRGVDSWGFEIRIQEWSYLDGPHAKERVSFIAVEEGRHELPSTMAQKGGIVQAGSFDTFSLKSTNFERIAFAKPFSVKPVVLASVVTAEDPVPLVGRIRNVDKTGFEFRLQKEEGKEVVFPVDGVNYLAWEPSSGALGGEGFEYIAGYSSPIDHQFTSIPFSGLGESPAFVADMQTTDGETRPI